MKRIKFIKRNNVNAKLWIKSMAITVMKSLSAG